MKGINKHLVVLLIQLFLANCLMGQTWTNLQLDEPSATAEGWETLRTPTTAGQVELPSGAIAMYLTGPYSKRNSGAIFQKVPFATETLQRFRATAMVKTKGATGMGASLYAYGIAKDRKMGHISSADISGDQDWTEISLTFVGDSRMDSIWLGFYMGGDGEAWFKDLQWEEVPQNTSATKDSIILYLDAFFQIVSTNALYREKIDWDALRKDADQLTAGAQKTEEVYDALQYILKRVNKHSFFQKPQAASAWSGGSAVCDETQMVD
jgi:hypothetical protein